MMSSRMDDIIDAQSLVPTRKGEVDFFELSDISKTFLARIYHILAIIYALDIGRNFGNRTLSKDH